MRFVGIDPGQSGAIVVVGDDGMQVTEHLWWKNAWIPPIAAAQIVQRGDVVSIERPYVGRDPKAAITLCEWIGWLRSLLPSERTITLIRPFASEWRAKVLRRARLGRALAKQLAVAACIRHSGLPHAEATRHDIAEAWLMARYAWGWQRAHGEAPEMPETRRPPAYSRST